MPLYTSPILLAENHVLGDFSCGEESLDHWLKQRALKNTLLKATRVYVTCPKGSMNVIGYYGLSTAEIDHSDLIGPLRRNMPDPVPAILLGRLAIDQNHQGSGLGYDLLKHAIGRAHLTSEIVGARVLMVHALSEAAYKFYESAGFSPLPGTERTLVLDINKISLP